jgi:hypothetical protein
MQLIKRLHHGSNHRRVFEGAARLTAIAKRVASSDKCNYLPRIAQSFERNNLAKDQESNFDSVIRKC